MILEPKCIMIFLYIVRSYWHWHWQFCVDCFSSYSGQLAIPRTIVENLLVQPKSLGSKRHKVFLSHAQVIGRTLSFIERYHQRYIFQHPMIGNKKVQEKMKILNYFWWKIQREFEISLVLQIESEFILSLIGESQE